jgi:uncharacterized membrane protein
MATHATREWTLRRNCSLAPRQLARAYALLCCFSLAMGIGFLLRGAWMVLAFSLVDLSVVGLALLVYARHATDRERIELSERGLVVESVQADARSQTRLDPLATRVIAPDGGRRSLVALESRGVRVEVGRFMTAAQRGQLARELRQALRAFTVVR